MFDQASVFFAFVLTFGFCQSADSAESVLGQLMAITKACGQDVQNLCAGAPHGGGEQCDVSGQIS